MCVCLQQFSGCISLLVPCPLIAGVGHVCVSATVCWLHFTASPLSFDCRCGMCVCLQQFAGCISLLVPCPVIAGVGCVCVCNSLLAAFHC